MSSVSSLPQRAEQFRQAYNKLYAEIAKVIVGHTDIVHGVLTCLFVGGHALLEGVPGLGKTLLVRTLSQAIDLNFNRVQFTPDLMPSDIIGTNIINEGADGQRVFSFQAGPIFAQIVLADEINRATPKTQSALLEAMQEHSVTIAGTVRKLEEPVFVMATHPGGEFAAARTNQFIRCGASPRAGQALVLAGKVRALLEGRFNVSFDDIRKVYLPALRHRILLNFEAQAENIAPDVVLQEI